MDYRRIAQMKAETEQTREPAAPLRGPKTPVELRTISAEEAGQRIDNFLMRHFSRVPRSRVYRLLRKGEVRVNRKRVDAEYRIAAGDEVRLPPVHIDHSEEPGRPSSRLQELIERSMIFQDKHLLVIDKPAGVAVHGGSGMSFGVIEALRASRPRETLELVHRLDRDTSGCLCVARDRATLVALHALIRDGGMHKTYLALVSGDWQLGTKRIDAPLGDRRASSRRAARARCRRGQGFGEHLQAGAVLRQARNVDAGGHSHRPHAPDPRACRLRGAPAAWATTSMATASATPSSRARASSGYFYTPSRSHSIGRGAACRFTRAPACPRISRRSSMRSRRKSGRPAPHAAAARAAAVKCRQGMR